MTRSNNLIYILNHYSDNSSQHFFHVINLLEEIAQKEVNIKLIIEKSEGKPIINNSNIEVFCLKNTGFCRLFELYRLISKINKQGYNKLFVRITNWGAIMAILNSFVTNLEVYFWHSGTVFEFDNEQQFSWNKVKWYFKTRLPFNFIKHFVTFFVTGPESMKEYYINNVSVNKDKIKILYNDIDTSRFYTLDNQKVVTIRKELGLVHNKKIILFVHNFSPVRKSELYIGNCIKRFYNNPQLQNYLFYFIGDGKDKYKIEKEVISMGYHHKVFFLGSLPNVKVHKFYQISDIFINPTHAEGFPRVLLEAMACGLPIVTTNAGGIKDILGKRQLDFMSDINNPNDFAINLIRLAQLGNLDRNLLKNENLEAVQKFCTKKVALMYIKTIFYE